MDKDFLPGSDAELIQWALQFATIAGADAPSVGLSTVQVTDFTSKRNDFQLSIGTAQNAHDAALAATASKSAKRKALVTDARTLARVVQAKPGVAEQKKRDLGLTVKQKPKLPVVPEIPIKISGKALSRTANEIFWNRSGNHPGTVYEIYVSTNGTAYTYLGQATATKFRHTGIFAGAAYSYKVRAVRSNLKSDFSDVTVIGADAPPDTVLTMDKAA